MAEASSLENLQFLRSINGIHRYNKETNQALRDYGRELYQKIEREGVDGLGLKELVILIIELNEHDRDNKELLRKVSTRI